MDQELKDMHSVGRCCAAEQWADVISVILKT